MIAEMIDSIADFFITLCLSAMMPLGAMTVAHYMNFPAHWIAGVGGITVWNMILSVIEGFFI